MSVFTELMLRCDGKCELCSRSETLNEFLVSPKTGLATSDFIAICKVCSTKLEAKDFSSDDNHWKGLNDSMWSEQPAVQAMSHRILSGMIEVPWAKSALESLYLDEDTLEWSAYESNVISTVHKDCNGNLLLDGDSVTLIKDLDVKGANFAAKRGTTVKKISLVLDNPEQIEGRVNDQQIVILTKFVKKV